MKISARAILITTILNICFVFLSSGKDSIEKSIELTKNKEYDKAYSHVSALIAQGECGPLAYIIRGQILLNQNRQQEAKQDFEMAFSINEELAYSYLKIYSGLYEAKDDKKLPRFR